MLGSSNECFSADRSPPLIATGVDVAVVCRKRSDNTVPARIARTYGFINRPQQNARDAVATVRYGACAFALLHLDHPQTVQAVRGSGLIAASTFTHNTAPILVAALLREPSQPRVCFVDHCHKFLIRKLSFTDFQIIVTESTAESAGRVQSDLDLCIADDQTILQEGLRPQKVLLRPHLTRWALYRLP